MSSINSFSMLRHSASAPQLTNLRVVMDPNREFREAAASGDLQRVRSLFEQRYVDVDAEGEAGENALILAVKNDHLDVVRYLIQYCEAATRQDEEWGFDCLITAVESGNLRISRYLIDERKMDINTQDNGQGTIVIAHAIRSGNQELVRYLALHDEIDLACGECDYDALGFAASEGYLDMVKLLVEVIGMNPFQEVQTGRYTEKNDAIHEAISEGQVEVVKWLIEEYPDIVHRTNFRGISYFCIACYECNLDIIRCFVDHGADVSAIGNQLEGYTAISEAALTKNGAGPIEEVRKKSALATAYLIEVLLAQE